MVTTVTSTVSILSTSAIADWFAVIGILVLISLLVQKELASVVKGSRFERLRQALNVGIVPLLIAFILTLVLKVAEVVK